MLKRLIALIAMVVLLMGATQPLQASNTLPQQGTTLDQNGGGGRPCPSAEEMSARIGGIQLQRVAYEPCAFFATNLQPGTQIPFDGLWPWVVTYRQQVNGVWRGYVKIGGLDNSKVVTDSITLRSIPHIMDLNPGQDPGCVVFAGEHLGGLSANPGYLVDYVPPPGNGNLATSCRTG